MCSSVVGSPAESFGFPSTQVRTRKKWHLRLRATPRYASHRPWMSSLLGGTCRSGAERGTGPRLRAATSVNQYLGSEKRKGGEWGCSAPPVPQHDHDTRLSVVQPARGTPNPGEAFPPCRPGHERGPLKTWRALECPKPPFWHLRMKSGYQQVCPRDPRDEGRNSAAMYARVPFLRFFHTKILRAWA